MRNFEIMGASMLSFATNQYLPKRRNNIAADCSGGES